MNVSTNDEILRLLKLFILLYADDTIIMAESPDELQLSLNALNEYCQTWKLKINIDKTKIIKFEKLKSHPDQEFWLNGKIVEMVDSYIYLGTTIHHNGKFTLAINKQITQAHRALFSIKSKKEKFNLPIDIVLDLFDTMILPILLYGCEIWGFENLEDIEVFYRKFLKYILNVKSSTADCMVYGETGTYPIGTTIKARMVCFWHKISTGLNAKLSYRLLYLLNKLHSNNRNKFSSQWLTVIKKTLNSCDLGHVWHNPKTLKPNKLKYELTQKLKNLEKQKWLNDVNTQSCCRIYRTFKNELKLERYLLLPDSVDRINIAKFRCRNSKIPEVILGYRYLKIKYENRKCSMCTLGEIGDEYHYILTCHVFQQERHRYLDSQYFLDPNREKFSELMQSQNFTTLRKLAKLIAEINRNINQFNYNLAS